MILSTSSGGSVRHDNLVKLAELGFTHVACRSATPNRQFEKTVRDAHGLGIQVIAIFPNWFDLGLCDEPFCFQTADGFTNKHFEGSEGRIEGPSHWCEEAEARWRPALQPLVDCGIDGILAAPMHSDRMTSTDWYPWESWIKYTTHFWSFDPYAKKSWAEISDEPMPAQALFGHDGQPLFSSEFYRWYQSGWLNRITQMADAALDAGLREIWTWWIPLDFPDAENAADMTYSSVVPMENWRQHIISRGGHPVTVSACLAGLWDRWRTPGLETMKQASTNLHWDCIAGAEAWGTDCFNNIRNNGRLYHDNGFTGLFCGEGDLTLRFDEAKKAFADVHQIWEGS